MRRLPAGCIIGLVCALGGSCNVPSHSWTEIAFDDVLRFRSPVPLTRLDGEGIDSRVGRWEGNGLRVFADYSPFADPLTSRTAATGHRVTEEVVDGRIARIVSAARANAGRTVAVHFTDAAPPGSAAPARLTLEIEADPPFDEETLLAMVRSITFTVRGPERSDSS